MSDHDFDRTIDWEAHWRGADEADRADGSPSAALVVDPLLAFLEERGAPGSVADVGCGPGAAVFALADRFPAASVLGYDAAESVLKTNRERATDRGIEGVAFERAVLPDFDPGREFDLVCCFFTLCYVRDVEQAIENLYSAVAPGGHLVFSYHNRHAQTHYRSIAESPHEYLDDDSPWDPDHFAERFELVIEGESLLSYRRIQDVLGTWPRSVFSVAEGAEAYGAHRYEPLVFVPA